MMLDQAMRTIMRDELRQALAEERAAIVGAVVAEFRKLQLADFLTTSEAAELARVEPKTIRRWVDGGKLSRHCAGGDLRIVRNELLSLLGCAPAGGPDAGARGAALTDDQVEAKVVEMLGRKR